MTTSSSTMMVVNFGIDQLISKDVPPSECHLFQPEVFFRNLKFRDSKLTHFKTTFLFLLWFFTVNNMEMTTNTKFKNHFDDSSSDDIDAVKMENVPTMIMMISWSNYSQDINCTIKFPNVAVSSRKFWGMIMKFKAKYWVRPHLFTSL